LDRCRQSTPQKHPGHNRIADDLQKAEGVGKSQFKFARHSLITKILRDLTDTGLAASLNLSAQILGLFNLACLHNGFLYLAKKIHKDRTLFQTQFASQHIRRLDAAGAFILDEHP